MHDPNRTKQAPVPLVRSNGGGNAHRPKLVRIIGRLSIGGPAHQIALLHQAIEAEFDTVLITGGLFDGEACAEHLLHSTSRLHRVPAMRRPIRPLQDLLALIRITALLRREQPDIVHTHCSKAGALGRIAAVLAGVPLRVHTYHGHIFDQHFGPLQSRLYLAIERMLGRITTRAIALSPSQAEDLAERYRVLPREKISVIRNGFDLSSHARCDRRAQVRRQLEVQDDQTLVVWAGRLAAIKNLELLAAVVRAARCDRRLRFAIVGNGTERPKLECAFADLNNVVLTGWYRDMAGMWSAADVALLTSHNEGTPAALIEAMAAGKPFVSTRVGGVVDLAVGPLLATHGCGTLQAQNAFLTGPDSGQILRCLEQLASEPDLARRMGSIGQAFALREFSAERLVAEISTLYRELRNRDLPAEPDALSAAQ